MKKLYVGLLVGSFVFALAVSAGPITGPYPGTGAVLEGSAWEYHKAANEDEVTGVARVAGGLKGGKVIVGTGNGGYGERTILNNVNNFPWNVTVKAGHQPGGHSVVIWVKNAQGQAVGSWYGYTQHD